MKAEFSLDYPKQVKTRQLLGLSYGLIAALAFTLTAWGIDAYQLARASADLFWLKLALGGLAAVLLGGLAGWLGEQIDNGLVTFVFWLVVSFLLARLASQLPFEITSRAVGVLHPSLAGLDIYPHPSNVDRSMVIVYIVLLLTGGLVGALQSILVDSAVGSATNFTRWITLAACVPFFLLAGTAVDNINNSLRLPLIATHDILEFAKANQGKPVDNKLAAATGLRAFESLQSMLDRPYHLVLGTYEPEYLDSFTIYIDFNGEWAVCSALVSRVSNCNPSQKAYLTGLNDLLSRSQNAANPLDVARPVEAWLATWKDGGNRPAHLAVLDQRGTAILVEVQDQAGRRSQCRLSLDNNGLLRLETCSAPGPSGPIDQAILPEASPTRSATQSPSLTVAPTGTGTVESNEVISQSVALLPAAVSDLEVLSDLTTYDIRVSVDFTHHSFQGHSRVDTLNRTGASLDRLYFRLFPNGGRSYGNGSLTVSQVTQDGKPITTTLSVENSVLEAHLAAPLAAGARASLEMDFKGVTPVDYGGGYGIYDSSRQVMALANWYPILAVDDAKGWHLDPTTAIGDSVYSEMAYYSVELTAPENVVVATTGLDVRHTDQAGFTTYWIASGPARDFFIALSPDFQVASQEVEGTRVNSYYLSPDAAGGQQALTIAGRALQDYNGLFGLYPYRELDVVEAPLQDALGVEYPGIILAASQVYTSTQDATFTAVIAHEIGHQWWYNIVGNNVLQDPWLDEGLTTFTSMLYFESDQGQAGYQGISSYYQKRYDEYLQKHPDDLVTASVAHFESGSGGQAAYGTIVYTKAALFFKALRDLIGDKAFFQALKAYYKDEKYKVADPQSLLDEFQKASGRDLGDFYQKWLYSKSQP